MNNPKAVVEMKHNFKMPSRIKNYKIEKEFCTVENAHICIANNININEKVLIKIYDKELFQYKHEELSLINNEIFMLRLINHRHCLKLYEIIESPSYVFLVMEYFSGITLSEYIKQKKKLSEDDALNIYKQLVSVLVYIHDMNIGHLNISSNNIYIDNTNNIKIFEFKYSVFYSSKSKIKCECLGDKLFLSPELCLKKQCNPELSDVWSSATILYMLAVGEHPFLTKNELDSQKSIMKGEFRLPTNMSKIMQDFFKTAFEVKEESRYTIEKMFKCALFRQKNITTDTLPLGLNVLSAKYPIDQRAMTICKNYFNLDQDELKQKLIDNVFDPETSLYKQIVSKFTNKKVSSDGDLISKKYSNYVNNTKYYYDEKIVKKNIQANLNKEYDIKQVNKDKEDDITRVQETSLIKLDDLLQSYEEYKKDPKSLDKRPKVNRKAEEEKKKVKQEAYEKEKAKLEGKDKENESKENTDKKSNFKKKNSKIIQRNSLTFASDDIKSTNFANKSRERKSVYDKKNNIKNLNSRRLSSNVNMDQQLQNSLEKFKKFQINQINKKSSMKKKYLNPNGIIEESKEEDENQKGKKEVKIKEEDYLDIPRRMPKRNKSLYQKKTQIKDDDDEEDKNDLSYKRTKSFYGKKNENQSLDKEEPVIDRKSSSKKMKSKSFYQKKGTSKLDEKDKEKQKDDNKILRQNSKKEVKSSEKKDNDNSSRSSSIHLSEEKNDVHDIDSNNINFNSKKSNKIAKKVSFQANDFNFLENVGGKRESIEKKPSLKERSSIERKSSLKDNNVDSIIKKPSLKVPSSLKKDSISIEEPIEKPEKNNNLESSTKIESERKNSNNDKNEEELKKRAEKLMEEERKQEEEEERKRQLEEEKKKEEEERRRLKREERERRRKERDEEDRKKEKEDKLRKEKEKERQKKEEDDKIKKWKEEAKKKKENEEKKRIAEEERIKKEEEDERRARREENEAKRQLEEQENNRRLEEYKNKQREEEDKRKKRENLRKQKEEEQRQKREKEAREAKERRNKFMKKEEPKKKGGESSDSGSGSEDDDSKNLKTLPNQDDNNMKKTFNFHSNPFDFFKTNDSDDESSPRVRKKSNHKSKRTSNEKQPKRKSSVKAKYNDFFKFSQGDKNASESEGSESSSDEEEKNNNKNNEKKKLSKSIEVRKNSNNNKKNSLYNKFNNYFFHENTFDDDKSKNKKNKDNKDSKTNQENLNSKKGFYHYQNNPTKEEKRVVDKRFELRSVNTTGAERFNQLNTDTITEDSHDNKKAKEGKNKKNKFVKQNSVEVRKANDLNGEADNEILSVKFKRGRNKNNLENRQNNSVTYNNDMNLENENNATKSKANQNKNNLKKAKNEKDKEKEKNKKQKKAPKNIVQNLMTDFDQTMEEYSSIYATHNTSTKGAKTMRGFNEKNNKLRNSKSKLRTSKSKNLNSNTKTKSTKSRIKSNLKDSIDKKPTTKITTNNQLSNSLNGKNKSLNNKEDKNRTNSMEKRKAKAKIKKDKDGKLKGKKGSNKDLNNLKNGNPNHASNNAIKIKRTTTNASSELKEEDLALYRGQIDYNNVSIKNVEESIEDLMMKYKKKGFICIKNSREQFIFVKGPNTHHVELMKLGNGLLYFCVTK